ncbi:MAG: cobalamin B12-binding domain-containing protein [Peptostreptococcaceae bacterium]
MDVYKEIIEKLNEGEAEDVIKLVEKAIAIKYPPQKILEEGLLKGIEVLADKFRDQSVLIPEALMTTRAFNAGLGCLDKYIKNENMYKGNAVIGTVEGDFHDIGKNIVKSVISSNQIQVIDLGIDVAKDEFISAIKKYKPDLVVISALLTTTMKEMKYIIDEIEKENLRDEVVIFVGGAPVTDEYADEIGADYYTEDALELKEFLEKNINKLLKSSIKIK